MKKAIYSFAIIWAVGSLAGATQTETHTIWQVSLPASLPDSTCCKATSWQSVKI